LNGCRRSLRSQFYRAARDLGNVEAAAKGPVPYGRRMARRKVYRSTNRVTADFLKRLGIVRTNGVGSGEWVRLVQRRRSPRHRRGQTPFSGGSVLRCRRRVGVGPERGRRRE